MLDRWAALVNSENPEINIESEIISTAGEIITKISLISATKLARKARSSESLLAGNGRTLSTSEMVDECITFFFRGHETTALTLTWVMLLLALHPDWQTQLREEIKQVMDDVYHRSTQKENLKSKSSKPSKSPSVGSKKRKRSTEAGGPFRSQDIGISPEDVLVRKTTTTTTSAEDNLDECVADEATEPILLPIDAAATPAVMPLVIIKDDDEATDEDSLAKKTKTSISTPPPPS
ncbi:hypothetical protein RND71_018327 [Anisodus tanguticus]|uniref:Cytochrome P450 n=1 Tax=Anisodus tanguticus TaxID=243964 RepID=A0AAE1VGU5_9SOLA|nr:hypothetical protein RND71_018327 [Anisodus tanguticus]